MSNTEVAMVVVGILCILAAGITFWRTERAHKKLGTKYTPSEFLEATPIYFPKDEDISRIPPTS